MGKALFCVDKEYLPELDNHKSEFEKFFKFIELDDQTGLRVFNLGTGSGVSVLALIAAFASACAKDIPYRIVDRRPGDVACLIADASHSEREWGWQTTRGLADMCRDAWEFQKRNPAGYVEAAMTTTSSSREDEQCA